MMTRRLLRWRLSLTGSLMLSFVVGRVCLMQMRSFRVLRRCSGTLGQNRGIYLAHRGYQVGLAFSHQVCVAFLADEWPGLGFPLGCPFLFSPAGTYNVVRVSRENLNTWRRDGP